MGKIIKLGMVFEIGNEPDFGGIRQTRDSNFTAPADDVVKLNSALTRTVCAPLMEGGTFPALSGDICFVPEDKTAYMYDEAQDEWFEVISDD